MSFPGKRKVGRAICLFLIIVMIIIIIVIIFQVSKNELQFMSKSVSKVQFCYKIYIIIYPRLFLQRS